MPRGAARNLTEGPISRHVMALALPAVLSTVVHQMYGLNDIYFSKFVSRDAQTAVSNNLFTLIVIFGFVQLASIGTLTLVSRRTGAGNEEGAERAARQGLVFAVIASVLTGLLGLVLLPLIPRLMGMAPGVTTESTRYLFVIFLGLPAIFLAPTIDSIFRARGDVITPLFLHVLAVASNIAGNYAAVEILHWGTVGIAASTILSRLVWVVMGFWMIRRGRIGLRLRRAAGRLVDLTTWRAIAKVSAPIAARTILFGFIYQVVSRIASYHGTPAQNGLGVGIRVEGLCFFIFVGFGLAAGPLVGQNLGAGKPDRAARAAWTTLGMALVPALVFMQLFINLPRQLMDLLTEDPASAAFGADYLLVISFCLVFVAMEVVLAHSFIGAGDTIPPTLVDIPLTALRIPLAYWLSKPEMLGIAGIWWTICGTAIARGVFMALWFTRGRWKRSRPDLD